jgi:hypothetical protein
MSRFFSFKNASGRVVDEVRVVEAERAFFLCWPGGKLRELPFKGGFCFILFSSHEAAGEFTEFGLKEVDVVIASERALQRAQSGQIPVLVDPRPRRDGGPGFTYALLGRAVVGPKGAPLS